LSEALKRALPIDEIREIEPDKKYFDFSMIDESRLTNDLRDKVLFKSSDYFGIINPIIVTPNAMGKLTIIDGYRRYACAKANNIKVPLLIKSISDPDEAIKMRIALNFSQKPMSVLELKKLSGEMRKPGRLREIGISTSYVYAVKHAPDEILRELEYRPPEVTMEVAKVSLIDKKKAEELVTLVKREDARTKTEVEKLKQQVNEMKAGVSCALCGAHLSEENRNWVALCSSCKWVLLEEYKETAFDKKIRDWLTGHYVYADEAIVVSKKALFDLINNVPEDVRINSGLEKVWMRLKHELGLESVGQAEQVSATVTVRR